MSVLKTRWMVVPFFVLLEFFQPVQVLANSDELIKRITKTEIVNHPGQENSCPTGYYAGSYLKRLLYFFLLVGIISRIQASETKEGGAPLAKSKKWLDTAYPCRRYGQVLQPQVVDLTAQMEELSDKMGTYKGVAHLPELPSRTDFACELAYLTKDTTSGSISLSDTVNQGHESRKTESKKKSARQICQEAENLHGLTSDECLAIINYTADAYRRLNYNLALKNRIKPLWSYESVLSRALQKLPPYEGWATRVDRYLKPEEVQGLFTVGKVIRFPTFLSSSQVVTTTSKPWDLPDEAWSLLEDESWMDSKVVFKIKSKTARDIVKYSHYAWEKEALFPNNAVFRVVDALRLEERLFVSLEEVSGDHEEDATIYHEPIHK